AEDVALSRDDAPSGGYFVGPMIAITDDPSSPLATEEIFGPLLVCLRARDFDHAMELANIPPYALTDGIFSRSPSRIRRAADEIRVRIGVRDLTLGLPDDVRVAPHLVEESDVGDLPDHERKLRRAEIVADGGDERGEVRGVRIGVLARVGVVLALHPEQAREL